MHCHTCIIPIPLPCKPIPNNASAHILKAAVYMLGIVPCVLPENKVHIVVMSLVQEGLSVILTSFKGLACNLLMKGPHG